MQIDESMVLDLSGHQSAELEMVPEGGSMPTTGDDGGLGLRALQVAAGIITLEYRGASEAVQLAWHGLCKQLSLFVTPGRCVLFQQQRLASCRPACCCRRRTRPFSVRAHARAGLIVTDASRLLNRARPTGRPRRPPSVNDVLVGQRWPVLPAGVYARRQGSMNQASSGVHEQLVEDQRVGSRPGSRRPSAR